MSDIELDSDELEMVSRGAVVRACDSVCDRIGTASGVLDAVALAYIQSCKDVGEREFDAVRALIETLQDVAADLRAACKVANNALVLADNCGGSTHDIAVMRTTVSGLLSRSSRR